MRVVGRGAGECERGVRGGGRRAVGRQAAVGHGRGEDGNRRLAT